MKLLTITSPLILRALLMTSSRVIKMERKCNLKMLFRKDVFFRDFYIEHEASFMSPTLKIKSWNVRNRKENCQKRKTSERKIKSKFVVSTASNQLDESIAFCKYLFSSFTQIYLCLSLFLTYSSLEKKKNSTKYSLSQHGDTCHPNRNDFIMLHTQHQTERVIERSIKIAWKIESLR